MIDFVPEHPEPQDPKRYGHVHSIETYSTTDGPGIRFVLFMQGCLMRCQYCHNPDTWSISAGSKYAVEEVMLELEPFVSFYQASGGGITVSGGEPLLQQQFVYELFKACKEKWGLHTTLDTSGFHVNAIQEPLLDVTDLVILDLKAWNDNQHQLLIGQSNASTLQFARQLAERHIPLWIRHVLVPGLTDDASDLESIGEFCSSLPSVEKVELLPYHSMGVEKWHALGWAYPLESKQPPTDEEVQNALHHVHKKWCGRRS